MILVTFKVQNYHVLRSFTIAMSRISIIIYGKSCFSAFSSHFLQYKRLFKYLLRTNIFENKFIFNIYSIFRNIILTVYAALSKVFWLKPKIDILLKVDIQKFCNRFSRIEGVYLLSKRCLEY